MKRIPLTKGFFALVDDEDFEKVNQFKWCAGVKNNVVYAMRRIRISTGRWSTQKLHRFILGITDPKIQIDHRDHDGLNNQRENLRVCTNRQNQQNVRKLTAWATTSQFKGVCQRRRDNKWRSRIEVNGKREHLGYFNSEVEAAIAYDRAALQHFGEFAHTNSERYA